MGRLSDPESAQELGETPKETEIAGSESTCENVDKVEEGWTTGGARAGGSRVSAPGSARLGLC